MPPSLSTCARSENMTASSNAPIRIAIVGLGKIARDQHLPAIAGNGAFDLVATVSPDVERSDGKQKDGVRSPVGRWTGN
jgi:predicted dehydrogenase